MINRFFNRDFGPQAQSLQILMEGMVIDMFRLWAKIFKDNRMIKDMVVCNDSNDMTRTQKIFAAIDEICHTYDLSKPIWLDATIADFKRHDKARFYQDNFMEPIEFDYLEIHVIEEG